MFTFLPFFTTIYIVLGFIIGFFSNEISYVYHKYIYSKYYNTYIYKKIENIIIKFKLNNLFSIFKWIIVIKLLIIVSHLLFFNIDSLFDGYKFMSGNDNVVNVDNSNVNVDKPNLTVNTPSLNLNVPSLTGVGVGLAAVKAGMELSKHVPGVGAKAVTLIGTAGLTAGIISYGATLGEHYGKETIKSIQNSSNDNIKNFLPDLDAMHLKGHVQGLDEFPLKLLEPLSIINYSAILFLILMLYVFVAILLKDKDLNQYLPSWIYGDRNIISRAVKYLINKNINIWYESRKFIIIFSCLVILFVLLLNQFTIYIILNSK